MAGYHIRVYGDDDYEMVRDVFKSGLEELAPDLFRYILKLPRTKFLLFGLPLAVYLSFKSVLLSASAAAVILGFGWFGAKYVFSSYVQNNLKGDMADIQQHYMQKKGARFWVAEWSGKVVGTVAAEPSLDPGGAAKVELKRMSVRKAYRGQGIGCATHKDTMAGYHIRVYEDDDYEMVRDVFKSGLEELAPDLFRYILKLPRTKFLLFGLPLAVYLSFKSVLLSASAAAVILGFGWFGAKYVFSSYVQHNLKGDMADIPQHYMQKKGACFWVAECSGKVVGTVAAEPYPDSGGAAKVELKRMSVRKGYRGQGIGKALCRTVLIFAKQEGYQYVNLGTSIVQDSGRRLYETMGFKMCHCFVEPFFLRQMFCFLIFSYQYDISECIW